MNSAEKPSAPPTGEREDAREALALDATGPAAYCAPCGRALTEEEVMCVDCASDAAPAQPGEGEPSVDEWAAALQVFVDDADVSLESIERVCEEFRRETGLLAPGKDESAAVNSGVTSEQRRAAWNEWSGKRIRARVTRARALLERRGGKRKSK